MAIINDTEIKLNHWHTRTGHLDYVHCTHQLFVMFHGLHRTTQMSHYMMLCVYLSLYYSCASTTSQHNSGGDVFTVMSPHASQAQSTIFANSSSGHWEITDPVPTVSETSDSQSQVMHQCININFTTWKLL